MTARTASGLWVPTPEGGLNSIEYLMGLLADNTSGDIGAADMREIVAHFASVDHIHGAKIATAESDAADAKATAHSAQGSANTASSAAAAADSKAAGAKSTADSALSKANANASAISGIETGHPMAAGSAHVNFTAAGGGIAELQVNFGKTFSKIPKVVISGWNAGSHVYPQRTNFYVQTVTTSSFKAEGVYRGESGTVQAPHSDTRSVSFNWIAVAI